MKLVRSVALISLAIAACDDKGASSSPAASSSPSASAKTTTTPPATESAGGQATAAPTPSAAASAAPPSAASSGGGGKCSLVGTWAGTYPPGPFPFSGTGIELFLKDDGTGGSKSARANDPAQEYAWKLDGDKFSLKGTMDRPGGGRYSCAKGQEGKYIVTFSPDCASITLKLVSDECKGRGRGIDGLTAKKK